MQVVGRALAAWQRGRNLDAIREFRKVARMQPDQIEYWIVIGDLEQQEELFAAAAKSYRRALRLMASGRGRFLPRSRRKPAPSEASTRRSLGAVLAAAGDLGQAEREFRRSLELDASPTTHVALGELLEQTGRVQEARACFIRALRLSRGHVEAMYRLGCVHMWTAPWRAERWMRRAIRGAPRHGMALCALGLLVGTRGGAEEADALLARAARTGEAGALPHVYRGHHAMNQGRMDDAIALYRCAMRAEPGDPHPHFALGDLYNAQERLEEAREAYEEALRIDPRCGDAALRLGYLHEEAGREKEAVRYLRRGLELTPQHPWAPNVRRLLERLGG